MELMCNCHLCYKMTPNPTKPTILCSYIELWRSMHTVCCCLLDHTCDWRGKTCVSPRCCGCRFHTKEICSKCVKMERLFIPCQHQPYHVTASQYCESYYRERKRKEEGFESGTSAEKNTTVKL